MKRAYFFFIAYIVILFASCSNEKNEISIDATRAEIRDAEKAFETMAAEKGIAEAFWFYADSAAVIKRQNDTLIHGKDAIKNFYSNDFYENASVKWSPDFIDVSVDGEMAYTYGKYIWQSKDSSGNPIEFKGIFHTVWKKQKNGEWKYVWD